MREPASSPVDVCLLLEGTYPHVRGGVSTWVHQVITALPEVSFGILYIGADRKGSGEPKYPVPENVRSIARCYLFDPPEWVPGRARSPARALAPKAAALGAAFLQCLDQARDEGTVGEAALGNLLDQAFALARECEFDAVWTSAPIWETLRAYYERQFAGEAFVDFFWNARFLVEPLWKVLQASLLLPEAKLYHSVSTGYAGILAAMMARHTGSPFLLSEHGIYVQERVADLLRTEWAPAERLHSRMEVDGVGALRHLWIELFVQLGRLTYHSARRIISLFQLNADCQAELGADPSRIQIIPNGVKLARFDTALSERRRLRAGEPRRQNVGFLGRVVSIKDVRTLIRAARSTCSALPDARFLIIGPTEEDEEYAEGCRQLIRELGLTAEIVMPGPRKTEEALRDFDVMVLSSVSEGLPFSILEAFAAEIPVVSTEVGSCPELVLGGRWEKPAWGPAGFIVPVGDAAALGKALTTLLTDRELQDRMGRAGRQRTEALYQEEAVMAAYHDLYRSLPAAAALAPAPQLHPERN